MDSKTKQSDEADALAVAYSSGFVEGKKRRPWVGLTDVDVIKIMKENKEAFEDATRMYYTRMIVRTAEKHLREKNNGS